MFRPFQSSLGYHFKITLACVYLAMSLGYNIKNIKIVIIQDKFTVLKSFEIIVSVHNQFQ
jgi:hypothetical protein